MKNLIYSEDKIIDKKFEDNQTKVILQNGTKLGEVLRFLPHGILDKHETGIGATTLELCAHRNSIIVEPLRVTAYSKAKKRTQELIDKPNSDFSPLGVLYVGSPIGSRKQKVEPADILDYHRSPGFKKIIVVADSFPRVIEAIGEDVVYRDYFLMIDEADSFQLDSTFREAMHICFDYFKRFPDDQRALVTATMLEFSDPDLAGMQKTLFKYEKKNRGEIQLFQVGKNFHGAVGDKLTELVHQNPEGKFLIAFNSPEHCNNWAKHLEKMGIAHQTEIAILCSAASKSYVSDYYRELQGVHLPSRINFVTSAYFSGFDLEENLHVVSISSTLKLFHVLSEHRIRQIAGRCRKNILSHTVIYQSYQPNEKCFRKQDLIKTGEKQVSFLSLLEQGWSADPVMRSDMKPLSDIFQNLVYARHDQQGKPAIAYLYIDAEIEAQRILQKTYHSWDSLSTVLQQIGYQVHLSRLTSDTEVEDHQSRKTAVAKEAAELIQMLRDLTQASEFPDLQESRSDWTKTQVLILKIVEENYIYISWDSLLDVLALKGGKGNTKSLKTLKTKLFLSTYANTSKYRTLLSKSFQVGSAYTSEEMRKNWTSIIQQIYPDSDPVSGKEAEIYTHLHFKVKKARSNQPAIILSENPLDVQIKSYRPEKKSFQEVLKLFRLL